MSPKSILNVDSSHEGTDTEFRKYERVPKNRFSNRRGLTGKYQPNSFLKTRFLRVCFYCTSERETGK